VRSGCALASSGTVITGRSRHRQDDSAAIVLVALADVGFEAADCRTYWTRRSPLQTLRDATKRRLHRSRIRSAKAAE